MKKLLTIMLALALCFGITACAEQTPQEDIAPTSSVPSTETTVPTGQDYTTQAPITYTYKAEAMQNVECRYYAPDAYVPNSPDPSRVQGKIVVWTQCPNCGEENIGSYIIDPATLDFSSGNMVLHSDTDSCYDCYWDKDIDQFMWTIRITRIPE